MKKILVFGNPIVRADSVPLMLLPRLRKEFPGLEFCEFDAAEDLEREGREIVLLDSVKGIRGVRVFGGVESFTESPRYSMHDFDLPIYLKLLKKMGIVEKATIIGVPSGMNAGKALDGVKKAIRKMMADG